MFSYSSRQMAKDWRFGGIEATSGEPDAPPQQLDVDVHYYGSETHKIAPKSHVTSVSLNSDESLLALIVGTDIQIYDTTMFKLRQVLKGHTAAAETVTFHPTLPLKLVSSDSDDDALSGSDADSPGSTRAGPVLIWWQLDMDAPDAAEADNFLDHLGTRAVGAVMQALKDAQSKFRPTETEQRKLSLEFTKHIKTLNTKHQVAANTKLVGRPIGSRRNQVFNADGSKFLYLPGDRPESNSVDAWDIRVWDVEKEQDEYTLHGHTDAIMWAGFSPDQKLIGSVSWDQTFRIWDAHKGSVMHTFHTELQNWIGAFSPDSRYFAGTSGDGILWIYDLHVGEQIVSHKYSGDGIRRAWARCLDWHPRCTAGENYTLALGTADAGCVCIFELDQQNNIRLLHKYEFSLNSAPEEFRSIMKTFLETYKLLYLPGGRKLAWKVTNDDAVQVYDAVSKRIMRFAPRDDTEDRAEKGRGFFFLKSKGLIASLDGDAVRFWKLPAESGDLWT